VKGIEPSYAAWEAAVLPLNYTRGGESIKVAGIVLEASLEKVGGADGGWRVEVRV
jgi:hypothetical protein